MKFKYIHSKLTGFYSFPPEPVKFAVFYKRFLASEKMVDDPRILRINFEDMIYDYDKTIPLMEEFIGKERLGAHSYAKRFFNPQQSIKNTQIYSVNEDWEKEVAPIADNMSELLYPFPYEIDTSVEEMSDPNPNTQKK